MMSVVASRLLLEFKTIEVKEKSNNFYDTGSLGGEDTDVAVHECFVFECSLK